MPSRGLGTFQPDPALYPGGSVQQSVLAALRAGCRHIDTSLRYGNGQGEKEVGQAVRESGIPREEIFIVTKLFVERHLLTRIPDLASADLREPPCTERMYSTSRKT